MRYRCPRPKMDLNKGEGLSMIHTLPFFYENSKLVTNETPNIAFVVRAVNQKFEIKA